jgi:acetylornithine deacetylase
VGHGTDRDTTGLGTGLSDVQARLASALDVDAMVRAIRRLVRIPSWNGEEIAAQELVAELMDDLGLSVDVWEIDLDAVRAHPDASWEIDRDRALGVVGSLEGGGGGPTLLLNGHVDVVPPGDEALWNYPPFAAVVEDGRIVGRGALDMKGPLMAGLFGLAAVRASGVELAGTVRLQSVVGEEDGGLGTLATLLRGYRGDGAIVMEPTDLAVVPVQSGCLNFRVRVSGRAAHGAVREEGVSAFEKLFVVYRALGDLERRRNQGLATDPLFARYPIPFPISVGTMCGGDWASSVPDHATMEGRLGVRPDESLADARRALEASVAEVASADPFLRDHPPRVEWWGGRFLPASTPLDHPLVRCLGEAVSEATSTPARYEAVPFGADAGLIQRVGGTPVVIFGAGDIRGAHRPDERVDIEALTTMARALSLAIVRFCGAVDRA